MALSSPGIGSGLDVNSIVNQLVALERRPIELLAAQKTRLGAELSSYGLLQSYMSNLQSVAQRLTSPAFWGQTAATSSAPDTVSATAGLGATPASYQLEVVRLAQATSLSSRVFGPAETLDAGTLTITVGGAAVDIAVAAGDTLDAVRTKINAAGAGVSAAIVRDSAGARLLVTGQKTGTAQAVTIAATGGNLAALAYPSTLADGITRRVEATDAELLLNGITLRSPGNLLTDVMDGVSLTLAKPTSGPITLTVANSTESLRKGVQDFVAAYNEANRYLAQQTRYDSATSTAGALQGERAAVGLQEKLRQSMQQDAGAPAGFSRLSDIGLELQRDGSIKVNDTRLAAALARPDALAAAFSQPGTGFGHRFKAVADAAVGADGTLTSRASGLKDNIKRNERDQQRQEDRVARTKARLTRQYAALDSSLNKLNGLSTYVSQQITNWNKSTDR